MVRVYQHLDKVPLNRSFDTAQTSDSLYSKEDKFPEQSIVTALRPDEKESLDTTPESSESLYSENLFPKQPFIIVLGPDEKYESQDPVGEIQEEQDVEVLMSDKFSGSSVYTSNKLKGEEIIDPEQDGTSLTSGQGDETEVAVNSAASLKPDSDEALYDSSIAALWDAVVTAGIVAGSQWKEDKPFDEESILEEGAGASVLEFRYPDESLDEVIEITMIADKAGRHAENINASAPVKKEERKRRRMALLAILCCLLLIVALTIGLLVGKSRNNKQTGDAFNVAGGLQRSPEDPLGEEDGPDGEEDAEELKLKLTAAPTEDPTPIGEEDEPDGGEDDEKLTATPTAAPEEDEPERGEDDEKLTATPTAAPKPTITPTLFTSPPSMEPSMGTPGPTMAPSDLPTASPTTSEPTSSPITSQPTPCIDQISVDQSCYVQGQDVVTIDFSQCNPQTDDWIGIYLDTPNFEALGDNYVAWSWACGSQPCLTERNTFTFNSDDFARTSFRAYLLRDTPNGAPYGRIVTSDVFTVAQNCPT
jgi:hypothetical protein